MLRSKGQPKRNVGPSTWPPKHTGSSDEYETDAYDPSEVDSSDDDEDNDGGAVARGARECGQRSGGSGQRSGGRTGGSKRNGSRSGGKKGSGSGRKKGSSVDLLDSDDSDVEVHRPLSKRASQKNTKKNVDSSDYDTDEDEGTSSRKGGGGGRSQRKALGRINGDRRGQRSSSNDSDDDDAIDSDSSEDSDALFRPKGRAPRRKAPQRKGKGSDSDDSDSSDSSDSDIGMHLGRNREKELAAKRRRLLGRGVAAGCSSSDESDSDADGDQKKKPARKGATLARSARAAKGTQPSAMDDASDSDDDSSVSFVGTSPRRNPKRGAASPHKQRAAKRPDARRTPPRAAAAANARSSIDQSFVASDDEGLPPMAEVTSLPRTQAAARQAPAGNAVAHDPSVRAASNAAIAKAKAAREALRAAQRYEAKEAELPAMELELPSTKRRPPVEETVLDVDDTAGVSRAAAPPSYTGRMIRVTLRYQHPQTKKDAKANVKIRMDQPLQHLVDEFRSQNGSLEVASMKFDGLNVDLSKTPTFYDMDDEDLVDTVVKERRGPGSRVFNVTSSPTKIQAAPLGRPVRLKFRANGKASEVETISVRLKETFSSAMARFAEKRNVSLAACKFIFDGEVLRPTQTPVGLDLEGDEIIDVKVPESGAAAGGVSGQARGSGAASARPSGGESRPVAPAAKISFQTNRNQNNATRQKTWKVSNTDPFSTLKADYTKYYKSKGCKRVVFYFRNAAIADNETRSFRDIGISGGDMIYAMENGKTYRPV